MATGPNVILLEQARDSRERAARCRRLAANAPDDIARRLEALAQEFEARASEFEGLAARTAANVNRSHELRQQIADEVIQAQTKLHELRHGRLRQDPARAEE